MPSLVVKNKNKKSIPIVGAAFIFLVFGVIIGKLPLPSDSNSYSAQMMEESQSSLRSYRENKSLYDGIGSNLVFHSRIKEVKIYDGACDKIILIKILIKNSHI